MFLHSIPSSKFKRICTKYKFSGQILGIVLMLSSCSHNIAGIYEQNEGNYRYSIYKELTLNKDTTFKYIESYYTTESEDIVGPTYNYVGVGHYKIAKHFLSRKKIILSFEPKFRKVYKIDILPLSTQEITELKRNDSYLSNSLRDSSSVIVNINLYFKAAIYRSLNSIRGDWPYGWLRVNDQSMPARLFNNNFIYKFPDFPTILNVDFEKFSVGRFIGYYALRERHSVKGVFNLNFGFLDEKIKFEKPGNYKVNIYLFSPKLEPWEHPEHDEDQAFLGERILKIKNNGIGDMRKKQ